MYRANHLPDFRSTSWRQTPITPVVFRLFSIAELLHIGLWSYGFEEVIGAARGPLSQGPPSFAVVLFPLLGGRSALPFFLLLDHALPNLLELLQLFLGHNRSVCAC